MSRLAAIKFLSRIQTGTETILEYADTLSDLIETAYPRVLSAHLDGLLRDRFLSGVLPRYQGWLRFQSCDTFQAAVSCGRKVEMIMQSGPAIEIPDVQAPVRQSARTKKNTVSTLDREVQDRQTVMDSSWKRRFFTVDRSPICLYCKRAGHVRRDCRKRLRDFGPPPDSNVRWPPTLKHEIFTTVGCREKRPRGCRGSGRSRRPDFVRGSSVSVREKPCAFGPIQRPVKVPVLEPTPGLEYLCAQMCNLDDPVSFPGSINAIIAGSAEEQPKEVTLLQGCGMIPCNAETVDVPVEGQVGVIEDMVNVPDLFLENGTGVGNLVSVADDQRYIPKVG
ncbi:MAG: hypothetical protein GY696_19875, partial [Gammaproteobacteria bacterium]|nr:hypothetical protein [Gammaproteobacteria bacterium]